MLVRVVSDVNESSALVLIIVDVVADVVHIWPTSTYIEALLGSASFTMFLLVWSKTPPRVLRQPGRAEHPLVLQHPARRHHIPHLGWPRAGPIACFPGSIKRGKRPPPA